MMMSRLGTGLVLAFGIAWAAPPGLAQQPAPVAFEVAAIRESLSSDRINALLSGSRRVPLTITDTRVSISQMSLAELLQRAFRIEPYQLFGPEWLNEPRFNIEATVPFGVNRDRVPEMLQALLAARFGLVTHRESRELPVFVLVVGKDGPKLQDALPETDAPSIEPGRNQTTPASPVGQSGRPATARGDFAFITKTETSTMTFKAGQNGTTQADVSRMTMGELAQTLWGFLGRPVLDRTELAGAYHVTLEIESAEVRRMMNLGGRAGGSSSGDNTPRDAAPANLASEPSGQSSIVRSVEKLGLELRARRMPTEVIIVDKISRTATPN